MPYQWTKDISQEELDVWPHRSLSRQGFVVFISITCLLLCLPLFAVLGSGVLWGLLPFLVLAVGGVWIALNKSYKDAELLEHLTLTTERIYLQRRDPRGRTQEWQANPYWASAHLHEAGGPVPNYLTLKGSGREVELGAFLSEDERKSLYAELQEKLSDLRSHPAGQD